jgi:hypothetical protein
VSYENHFSLKLKNPPTTKSVNFCTNCVCQIDSGKFCPQCGTELIKKDITVDCTNDIISEFRKDSEDANYLLRNDGSTECTGSGHTIENDLLKFSKKYSTVIFELLATWDSGFDDPPSKFYILNGKIQRAKTKVIFDEFDITKLK